MIVSLALLNAILAGANLSAADPSTEVRQQYLQWERRLRNKVAERNLLPASALKVPACTVAIGFKVDYNRRPADIEVLKSSCGPFHRRMAQRLVRQLGRVGQVPSASGRDHRVVLNLSYGGLSDPVADRRLSDALESERQVHARRNLEKVAAADARTTVMGQRGAD